MGETLLWRYLSARKCCGLQFNRQKPLGKYIVDFYCKAMNLVIEIDGYAHGFAEVYQKDVLRQKEIEAMGLIVLRFTEREVRTNIDNVLQAIVTFVKANTNPPSPLSKGEENGLPITTCRQKQIPLTPFQRGKEKTLNQ